MNKDTALANVDKLRELITRLPDDARIIGIDFDYPAEEKALATVHVSRPFEALGKKYTVLECPGMECRFEHRYYPAGDLEDAGYLYLAKRAEAGK